MNLYRMCSYHVYIGLLRVLVTEPNIFISNHIFYLFIAWRCNRCNSWLRKQKSNYPRSRILPSAPAESGNIHYRKDLHYACRHLTFMSTKQSAARLSSVLTTPTHYPPYFKCHPYALFRKSSWITRRVTRTVKQAITWTIILVNKYEDVNSLLHKTIVEFCQYV